MSIPCLPTLAPFPFLSQNVLLRNNSANMGGAVFVKNGGLSTKDVTFELNAAAPVVRAFAWEGSGARAVRAKGSGTDAGPEGGAAAVHCSVLLRMRLAAVRCAHCGDGGPTQPCASALLTFCHGSACFSCADWAGRRHLPGSLAAHPV